jgi:uncharacterized membrane protein YtjA (UPF0391 family)
MLRWALVFASIALLAGLFGFTGIAAGIAKFLLYACAGVVALFVVLGLTVMKKI